MKTIRLADIKENDIVDGEGITVSVWTQGCPHHCPGCHNPETWNFNGGTLYYQEQIIPCILKSIGKNEIKRDLSILRRRAFMSGEPRLYMQVSCGRA